MNLKSKFFLPIIIYINPKDNFKIMEEDKYIIASSHSEAGIANRIKCLVSVIRLCKKIGREPLLLWMPPNLMGGADFSELFDNKINRINKREVDKLIKAGEVKICNNYEDCLDDKYKYFLFDYWGFVLLPREVPEGFAKVFTENKGKSIDLEYERIPLKLRKEFLPIFKKMSPIESIKKRVSSFTKENDNFKNVIGLHLRRRDFLLATDGRGRVSSDEQFFKKMQEIIEKKPDTKFFLATDCFITRKKFIKKFPGKIIFFPNNNPDKSTPEATQAGLIDILLLSKTNHILGSFLSSFAEVAWWFGGAKAKVEIIGDEKSKKQALDSLKTRSSSSHYSKIFRPIKKVFKFLTLKFYPFRFLWDRYLDYKTKKEDKNYCKIF